MSADLWQKMLNWTPDDPSAERPFSHRLREANEWDEEFTQMAIQEYRKFMYLKAVTELPLTPSVVVDSVWHMHILYTRNYQAFCRDFIGYFVHHDPGSGAEDESERFKLQYFDTLMTYIENFGQPPQEIWGSVPIQLDTGSAES